MSGIIFMECVRVWRVCCAVCGSKPFQVTILCLLETRAHLTLMAVIICNTSQWTTNELIRRAVHELTRWLLKRALAHIFQYEYCSFAVARFPCDKYLEFPVAKKSRKFIFGKKATRKLCRLPCQNIPNFDRRLITAKDSLINAIRM